MAYCITTGCTVSDAGTRTAEDFIVCDRKP